MTFFRSKLVLVVAAVGVVVIGSSWLWAQGRQRSLFPGPQPAFGQLIASPPNFIFNTPTPVTFTIRIDVPTLNPTTVELQRVGADGNLLNRVGRMYDNGQGGDSKPGDRVFTTRVTLNESQIGRIYFRVAAAFRGNQQNAQSALVPVDVDPFQLPPDPGEAGKQTLAGIDSDGDGVRDDVQRWIGLNVPSPRERRAFQDLTRATQDAITAVNASGSQAAAMGEVSATECLFFMSSGSTNEYRLMRELMEVVKNTEERRSAYDSYRNRIDPDWLDSGLMPEEFDRQCSADVNALPR